MKRCDIDILSRDNVSEGKVLTGFMALMFYDGVRRPVEASRTQCGANKARSCVYSAAAMLLHLMTLYECVG